MCARLSGADVLFLLLFALLEFPFVAKSLREALLQKSEQFFRMPELHALAGVNLFHRPFELASCEVRPGCEPKYISSSHDIVRVQRGIDGGVKYSYRFGPVFVK
jgi:hypothetical protein